MGDECVWARPPGHSRTRQTMPYKDPEKQREADRRWREANPEKAREVNRRWRAANPEKQREATRRWHEANPEKGREQIRRWRDAICAEAMSRIDVKRLLQIAARERRKWPVSEACRV